MKSLFRNMKFFVLAAVLLMPANAALQAAGPVDPSNGFPQFYRDANGVALQQCLADATGFADPFCTLVAAAKGVTIFNASAPIHFPDNFPQEVFYWTATSRTINGDLIVGQHLTGRATLTLALEGAFATLNPKGAVQDGQQVTFLRINLAPITGLVPGATYTVTHPFGSFTVTADAAGNTPRTRFEDGCLAAPCNFSLLLPAPTTNIGQFLALTGALPGGAALNPADPAARYIGNGALLAQPNTITPGPNGDLFRIDGPDIGGPGINSAETNLWIISGKLIISGVTAAVDGAASSARTAGTNTFATYALRISNTGNALDTFNLTISSPTGAIAATDVLTITLGAGKSGTVLLNVMSAAPGSYIVNVIAASMANPAQSAAITTTTTITGISPSVAMLKPAETMTFSAGAGAIWSSSNPAVGTIDPATGVFTAAAPGTTTITAGNATALVIVGASRFTSQPLFTGFNLIIVPVQPDPAFTASRLLQLVTAQNPGVAGQKLVRWDAASQLFETFDPIAGLIDFPILARQAYFIKVPANAANISIVGALSGIT